MKKITVEYTGLTRNITGKSKEEVSIAADKIVVRELLDHLIDQYGPDFAKALYSSSSELQFNVRIYLGDRDISGMDGLDTEIAADGGSVSIMIVHFPVIGG